jgi:fructose-bisphosphate aldolase, class II
MKKVVAERMRQFGQAGHAGDYTPIAIPEMAKGYASGKLDPRPSLAGAR